YYGADERKPFVSIGIRVVPRPQRFPLEDIGKAQRKAVAEVVQRVGQDCHAVGVKSAHEFDYREQRVNPKRRAQVARAGVVMMVRMMPVFHSSANIAREPLQQVCRYEKLAICEAETRAC